MFHKVNSVKPLEDYQLYVVFKDGTVKEYDVKPLMGKWEAFSDLKTVRGLFEQVSVDQGGYGISWNDNIDIACDELWHNGAPRFSGSGR